MTQQAAGEQTRPVAQYDWLHFPYHRLVGNRKLEAVTARVIWLAIPLEYYVLTRIPGGLRNVHAVAVVLVSLLAVMGVLAISVVIAALSGPRVNFNERLQGWSVSLVLNWVVAVFLLALGYLLSASPNDDVVHQFLSERLKLNIALGNYPHILDPQTFVVYLIYSAVALGLVMAIAHRFGSGADDSARVAPNVLVLAPLTALLMMLLHGATNLH